eukprot:GILJ01025516.1.p1 GENE.GILJ01025516.1~~GILJ01025516.1.p1  ORF type:complete len:384 (-),score=18.85 GILJ01025516.1:277-1428(-)
MYVKTVKSKGLKEYAVFYEGGRRYEKPVSSVDWREWNEQNVSEIFHEVHEYQHHILELAEEPGKGIGLRLTRPVRGMTIIATGVSQFMTHAEEELKHDCFVARHGLGVPHALWGVSVKWTTLQYVGSLDPSNQDYELSVHQAPSVGLFWWANEPSKSEHCNVIPVPIKIADGNVFGVALVTLHDLPAGAFILNNYGTTARKGYEESPCIMDGESCWHNHVEVNFPVIKFPTRQCLIKSPITERPILLSRPSPFPTFRSFTFPYSRTTPSTRPLKRRRQMGPDVPSLPSAASSGPFQFTLIPRVTESQTSMPRWGAIHLETIPDGCPLHPSTNVIKTWELANVGSDEWPAETFIIYLDGPSFGTEDQPVMRILCICLLLNLIQK